MDYRIIIGLCVGVLFFLLSPFIFILITDRPGASHRTEDSKESSNEGDSSTASPARQEHHVPMEWVNLFLSAKSSEEHGTYLELYDKYRVRVWVKENWEGISKILAADAVEDKKWLEKIKGQLDLNSLEDRLLLAKAEEIVESANTEHWWIVTRSENLENAQNNPIKELFQGLLEDQLQNRNPPQKNNES